MDSSPPQRFQVNLAGVISVLSEHLYSTPTVAFRELLQNSADAIAAREALTENRVEGMISLELTGDAAAPTLVVEDNGIGLTEEEVHQFLATIGSSSKRADDDGSAELFLGQFGIGLLSCFVLSHEIVLITRSAKSGGFPAVEWRGSGDGTYAVRTLSRDYPAGTRLYLKIRPAQAALCVPETLAGWLRVYGEFLPVAIELSMGGVSRRITRAAAPWGNSPLPVMSQREIRKTGTGFFREEFLDMIPVRSVTGGLDGVALISGKSRGLQAKSRHRLYLKGMLLSENAEGLTPGWAVFAHILANTTRLQPTASRESLVEGPVLEAVRQEIGHCLLDYLRRLAESDQGRLSVILGTHGMALKSLALENDEVLRFIAPWFLFETSRGPMRFADIMRLDHAGYCVTADRFRQLAPVAAAEGRCLINAGHVFEAELMAALAAEFPEAGLEEISAMGFSDQLNEVPVSERGRYDRLLEAAAAALRPHLCRAEVRVFQPVSLPVLYVQNEAAHSRRLMEQSKKEADDFFSGLLGDLTRRLDDEAWHICHLNAANPLIQKMAALPDPPRLQTVIEVLYFQALLLGQYPVTSRETRLLSDGLMRLIDLGLGHDPGADGGHGHADSGGFPAGH